MEDDRRHGKGGEADLTTVESAGRATLPLLQEQAAAVGMTGSKVLLLDSEEDQRPASRAMSSRLEANYRIHPLTDYIMDDQRWTLTRKKIGLKRKTVRAKEKNYRNERVIDHALSFVRTFNMKECIRFTVNEENEGKCYCGLDEGEHHFSYLPSQDTAAPDAAQANTNFNRSNRDHVLMVEQSHKDQGGHLPHLPQATQDIEEEELEDDTLRARILPTADTPENMFAMTGSLSRRTEHKNPPRVCGALNFRNDPSDKKVSFENETANAPTSRSQAWNRQDCIREYPTNAYGLIDFINETSSSNKPAKYVRMSDSTDMESVLTMLTKYWHLAEPTKPNLVLSVTGGAKHFRLDGVKKSIFTTGLIKAVRSTNAWLITGGQNVGVMRSVGEAVKEGQHIIKVKLKDEFGVESNHLARGIKCLGVAPWGYVRDNRTLVNPDPLCFSKIKYKAVEKTGMNENLSLNEDHTHFIMVDNGKKNFFSGADRFRTRLEEVIQSQEPPGLGIPVVLLILDGGLNSIKKCSMALKSRIPVVVVAGTGRAADLIAYGVSMTRETPTGRLVMRKAHRQQLNIRAEATMVSYDREKQKIISDLVVECCKNADMITIFDINSQEDMDKYILYALLKGDGLSSEASSLDQLHLSLLWNRPDIAETDIFPARTYWPTEMLEELTTIALLEEKVEFVRLFAVNGLVTAEYLTVGNLRHLYNASCEANSHLSRLLQRTTSNGCFYLHHVDKLLKTLLGHHNDAIYRDDTHSADPKHSTMTFEDPYQELFLWAVLSERGNLARYLWGRCISPMTAAVVGSALSRALWRSIGAKSTQLRERYLAHSSEFEKLAVGLSDECYGDDPVNAMGLLERRNTKWGNLDCLDLALSGNEMNFIASSCSQASIDLSWRRGMLRASTLSSLITIFLPFLTWTRLFRFQRLGDDGGELTNFQKMIVFYRSPMTKFYSHSMAFFAFLALYSYVVLFDFSYQMSISEVMVLIWILTYVIEDFSQLLNQQSKTFYTKLGTWWESVWNRFDVVSFTFASCALVLRMNRHTFTYGRIAYAFNTTIFFCRLLRIYHVHFSLGPKLVIFYRMLSEVLVFMALLVIFILGYGLAAQSLLQPSPSRTLDSESLIATVKSVILTPYWQMYGELQLDVLQGADVEVCHFAGIGQAPVCENPSHYTWAVHIMLMFYLIIGNIMLLNLLIAIFTYVFDEVQENSMEIWKFERYRLIREYDTKPGLVAPFLVLEHILRLTKYCWKLTVRRRKENLDGYMSSTLLTLLIFEKKAAVSYLAKLSQAQEETLLKKVSRIADKIDVITKFVEEEKGMREIEKDLEYTENTDDLEESMIDSKSTSATFPVTHSPTTLKSDKDQPNTISFNLHSSNHLEDDPNSKNVLCIESGKGLSSSEEDEEDADKEEESIVEKFESKITKNSKLKLRGSAGKHRVTPSLAENKRLSAQKSKVKTITRITSTRNQRVEDSPTKPAVTNSNGQTTPEGEADELGEEISDEDIERHKDRLRQRKNRSDRPKPSSELSNHRTITSSTKGTAYRQPSSRLGSSTSRHSLVVSTRLAMQEVTVLGRRIDDITGSVAETQRDVKRLIDMMTTSDVFKSRSDVSRDREK